MKTRSINIFLSALILFSVSKVQAGLAEVYFPLNVGNSWTYTGYERGPNGGPIQTEYIFTIIGTEEIDGFTYYRFNDYFNLSPAPPEGKPSVTMGVEMLFRYDPISDRVIMSPTSGMPQLILYDFSGDEWFSGGSAGDCRLRQSGVTCNVPAGQFFDCINFQFGIQTEWGPDVARNGEYLSPNVGIVKYVIPGGSNVHPYLEEGYYVTLELKNYTIIPEPATVLLLGLGGIFAFRRRRS